MKGPATQDVLERRLARVRWLCAEWNEAAAKCGARQVEPEWAEDLIRVEFAKEANAYAAESMGIEWLDQMIARSQELHLKLHLKLQAVDERLGVAIGLHALGAADDEEAR